MENSFEHTIIPLTSITSGEGTSLVHDLYCLTVQIANVCFIGDPKDGAGWVLVDAGTPHSAHAIIDAAEARFGEGARPHAILLTHGHFDHVGAIFDLIEHWDVSVFAHTRELPYLTGECDYPPGNPHAGGGLVSTMSPLFPHHGIDLGADVKPLPANGSVPFMPEWEWIPTPGHTPGHISLFREKDRSVVAGDAFITVKQESLYHVIVQDIELHGPPAYFTPDWSDAYESVKRLSQLEPSFAIAGHGRPVHGHELKHGLENLLKRFFDTEVPHNKHH
jgi:glyoxylase-like metal-dependent hydrolase (beta-lactamase superfamily II)